MKTDHPTEEQVRQRAYEIFLQRGSQPGHEIDDWLQAEYELMQLPVRKIARALKVTEDRPHDDRPPTSFVAGGGGGRVETRERRNFRFTAKCA